MQASCFKCFPVLIDSEVVDFKLSNDNFYIILLTFERSLLIIDTLSKMTINKLKTYNPVIKTNYLLIIYSLV